mmetsp:Transcript_40352/g.40913  ORF Transcript_40352/g.40913 Transcript_40352/m.40913 type:complete len:108 (+) Transcript_40352:258-581(+)
MTYHHVLQVPNRPAERIQIIHFGRNFRVYRRIHSTINGKAISKSFFVERISSLEQSTKQHEACMYSSLLFSIHSPPFDFFQCTKTLRNKVHSLKVISCQTSMVGHIQ